MQCVVPGANVGILARAIHALAKIGDEIYVYPKENELSFRTVNLANSAYADFTFSEGFFSYYIFDGSEEEDTLTCNQCKISMRSALAVFKTPNLLDKQVETCHITFTSNASNITFILKHKNSVAKRYLLPILDSNILNAGHSKNNTINEVRSQPRVLADAVQNFQQNLSEITLQASPEHMFLRNYVDDVSGLSNTTRTQLALSVREFERYDISTDTTITFCMKELRAILNFAELTNVPVSMHFESAGKPIIIILKSQTFEAMIVLSTMNYDSDTQTDTTISSKVEKHRKTRGNKRTSKTSKRTTDGTDRRSVKAKTTLPNNRSKNLHPALMGSQSNAEYSSLRGRVSALTDELEQDVGKAGHSSQNIRVPSPNFENQSSNSNYTSTSRTSLNNKEEVVSSIFSTITKRKSKDKSQDEQYEERLDDTVSNSPPMTPPAKKARVIFQKCFQNTFDPKMLPGHDVILAEDSDEYCSD